MGEPCIMLVCGGRNFRDKERLFAELDRLHNNYGCVRVLHGGANGADYLAGRWAQERGIPVREYLADWSNEGRAAGPIRNQKMLRDGKPTMVVAFPGGIGTADMVRRAREAGIPVVQIAALTAQQKERENG